MRPMRILSIDGGGMKGVFACSYLNTLEKHFQVSLYNHFDLIAGTSTGGIIALGIGARKSAADILEFYREHGRAIFPPQIPGMVFVNQLSKGHGYTNKALRRALKGVFVDPQDGHELTMSESAVRLCIPAVNAATCAPRVFKSTFDEAEVAHLTRDKDIKMADVALATSAAPWYLPIAAVQESGTRFTYVDGGLWANNPSVVGVTEALTYYCGERKGFDGVQLLSVALPSSAGYGNRGTYRRGKKFIDQLLTYAMESSKLGAHQTAKFLLQDASNVYYRVQPVNLTEAQSRRLRLDSAERGSIEELMMLGKNDAENDKNVMAVKAIFK